MRMEATTALMYGSNTIHPDILNLGGSRLSIKYIRTDQHPQDGKTERKPRLKNMVPCVESYAEIYAPTKLEWLSSFHRDISRRG